MSTKQEIEKCLITNCSLYHTLKLGVDIMSSYQCNACPNFYKHPQEKIRRQLCKKEQEYDVMEKCLRDQILTYIDNNNSLKIKNISLRKQVDNLHKYIETLISPLNREIITMLGKPFEEWVQILKENTDLKKQVEELQEYDYRKLSPNEVCINILKSEYDTLLSEKRIALDALGKISNRCKHTCDWCLCAMCDGYDVSTCANNLAKQAIEKIGATK